MSDNQGGGSDFAALVVSGNQFVGYQPDADGACKSRGCFAANSLRIDSGDQRIHGNIAPRGSRAEQIPKERLEADRGPMALDPDRVFSGWVIGSRHSVLLS